MAATESEFVVVRRKEAIVGGLTRRVVDLASRHGLGDLRCRELLTEEPPVVSAGRDVESLRVLLASPNRPFAVVVQRGVPGRAIVRRDALPFPLDDEIPVVDNLAAPLRERMGRSVSDLLRLVGTMARARGEEAYLVGGPVRDLLLDRKNVDLDLAVVGDAADLARELAARLNGRLRIEGAFGTASIFVGAERRIDLATARSESYAQPAALPEVRPSGMLDDLLRRDFSINALALALDPGRFGDLLDPSCGRKDLRARRIRVLHGLSFFEDPTRIFRALRFAARLGFDPSPHTARLIRVGAARDVVAKLSSTRLRRELAALLSEPHRRRSAELLRRHRLWATIDAALRPPPRTYARLQKLDALLARLGPLEGKGNPPLWILALGLLCMDLRPSQVERIVTSLRPSRREKRWLAGAQGEARGLLHALRGKRGLEPGWLSAACDEVSTLSVVLAAVSASRPSVRRTLERYLEEWRHVRPDIDGRSLLRAGVPAGPAVARGLAAALRAKRAGRAPDAKSQLKVALRSARRASG